MMDDTEFVIQQDTNENNSNQDEMKTQQYPMSSAEFQSGRQNPREFVENFGLEGPRKVELKEGHEASKILQKGPCIRVYYRTRLVAPQREKRIQATTDIVNDFKKDGKTPLSPGEDVNKQA